MLEKLKGKLSVSIKKANKKVALIASAAIVTVT